MRVNGQGEASGVDRASSFGAQSSRFEPRSIFPNTYLLPYPDSTRPPENEMLGAPLVWIYSRSEAGLKKSNTLYNYSVFRGRHKIEMPRKIRAPTNDVSYNQKI